MADKKDKCDGSGKNKGGCCGNNKQQTQKQGSCNNKQGCCKDKKKDDKSK